MKKSQAGGEEPDGSRGKQILTGAVVLSIISGMMVFGMLGSRMIPGWVGDSARTLAGILTTPFFMEAGFAVIGIVTVIALNVWRRHKEGDEFVTIEMADGGTDDQMKGGK